MKFTDIPGYEEAKNKLFSMIREKRIGHALAFSGGSGSGNFNLALALAQYMSCEDPGENDSCGVCRSCVKFEKFSHPDLHFYFPVTTSKKVSKNPLSQKYAAEWREFLKDNEFISLHSWLPYIEADNKEVLINVEESQQIIRDLSLKSYESKFRFALIWLPEKMNIASANKLLKIIEEPPPNVFFFLVTENPELLLPTIISRLQMVRIGNMTTSELREWLVLEFPEALEGRIDIAVVMAEGNPLKALNALNSEVDRSTVTEDFITWARLCYEAGRKLPELVDWSAGMASRNKDNQKEFLNYGLQFFRSGILTGSDSAEILHLPKDETQHINNFSKLLNPVNAMELATAFNDAIYHLERYANPKLVFMDLSIEFGKQINPKNVNLSKGK